jgi:hypothetical protein
VIMSAIDCLGWSATFVFVGSYFCGRASALRRTQMAGAMMWILYGSLLRAYPVVVANVLVVAAAAWTQIASNREPRTANRV